jgi:hypothetical protein
MQSDFVFLYRCNDYRWGNAEANLIDLNLHVRPESLPDHKHYNFYCKNYVQDSICRVHGFSAHICKDTIIPNYSQTEWHEKPPIGKCQNFTLC